MSMIKLNEEPREINAKCIKCGKTITAWWPCEPVGKTVIAKKLCSSCGFNVGAQKFNMLCKLNIKDVEVLPEIKLDVFYKIDGKIYSYEEARKKERFDPQKGDCKIAFFVREDGSRVEMIPTDDQIERYLKFVEDK